MGIESYRAQKTRISYGKEVPTIITLGVTPNATLDYTLTRNATLDGTLVAGRFEGQIGTFVSGAAIGKQVLVTKNSASVITIDRKAGADGLNASVGDRISITTKGQLPTLTNQFYGVFGSNALPKRVRELYEGYYQGHDNMPTRAEAFHISNSYDDSFNFDVKFGKLLAWAFGKSSDVCNVLTGQRGTLAQEVIAGDNRILTSSAVGLVTGELLEIQANATVQALTGEYDEIREITAINGSWITLDEPLSSYHTSGQKLFEPGTNGTLSGSDYITHTLEVGDHPPTYTFEYVFRTSRQDAYNDIVFKAVGLMAVSLELTSSPGSNPLQASLSYQALGIRETTDNGTPLTKSAVTIEDPLPTPYLFSKCVVKVGDVEYPEAADWSGSITRNVETSRYHQSGNRVGYLSGDPSEHWEGKVSSQFNVNLPLRSKEIIDLVKNGTEFDVVVTYTRNQPVSSVDYDRTMVITFQDCKATDPGYTLPEEGAIPQDITVSPRTMKIQIQDQVPHY